MGPEEGISEAIRPAVQAAGLEIWDIERVADRSGASLRILVEKAGGVDLDAIAELSGTISAVLDERDDLVPSGRYTLEVSSPGLERRLRLPRHFARYVGQEVAVKTVAGSDGPRRLRGTLLGATDEQITVRVPISPTDSQDVRQPLSSVERANTVFTWGQPPRPSRAKRTARKSVLNRAALPAPAPAVGPHLAPASEEAR